MCYFTHEDGAVLLTPDMRKYFPDAESWLHTKCGPLPLIDRIMPTCGGTMRTNQT